MASIIDYSRLTSHALAVDEDLGARTPNPPSFCDISGHAPAPRRQGSSTPDWASQVAGIMPSDIPTLMDKLTLVDEKRPSAHKSGYESLLHTVARIGPPPGLSLQSVAVEDGMAAIIPPPPTAPSAIGLDSVSNTSTVSLGTVGHPHSCGQACRYVRRKGGCRDGAMCKDCHQCSWRRGQPAKEKTPAAGNMDILEAPMLEASSLEVSHADRSAKPSQAASKASPLAISLASSIAAQPSEEPFPVCSPCSSVPAVYIPQGLEEVIEQQLQERAARCIREAESLSAIAPHGGFSAYPSAKEGLGQETAKPAAPVLPLRPKASSNERSLGSVGHPYNCGSACRYVWRKVGCRMGADCPDCHLCPWRRGMSPKEPSEPSTPSTAASASGASTTNFHQITGFAPNSASGLSKSEPAYVHFRASASYDQSQPFQGSPAPMVSSPIPGASLKEVLGGWTRASRQ